MELRQVLCADCLVPIEQLDADPAVDRAACPRCGRGDRYEAVISEAEAYVQEEYERKVAELVGDTSWTGSGRQWRFVTLEVE